ncbi:hypothetical protein BIT28_01910 [Photobacterium proteolyticum]|uniref:Flagellar protein FlgN n=2 Tax=Photobacterium proteolyticum TaxID=1903952 RepID=A0A1Q9GVE9_9GAMM|nr:hypothetical protein BIT28_01910 [Photobacterium proteolyticum]
MANPINKQQAIMLIMKGIQHDVRQYKQLHQLMVEQQESYLKFDGEALQELIAKQRPLIANLSRSAAKRSELMALLGLSQTKAGMATLLQALPEKLKKPMNEYWQTLELCIRSCHQLNQLNGQISASYSEMLQQVNNKQSYSSGNLMQL